MIRATLVVICALLLAGCAGSVSPSQLEPPAAILLSPPPKLPDVKEGDDAVKLLIDTRRRYISIADRHRRLQTYVKTILKR